jgi:DNA polymerase-1
MGKKASKLPQANCKGCPLRGEPLVPPFGDGQGYIMIVGEAPGATEVDKGRPFVGQAGKYLRTAMLSAKGIDLERVYYTNAVMCRPPKNRDPNPEEIQCCRDRLFAEISKVKPKVIVPLGGFGLQALTGHKESIKKARGKPRFLDIQGKTHLIMPSLHPAYIMRTPDDFPDLVDDLSNAQSFQEGAEPIIPPPIDQYILIQAHEANKMESLLRRLEDVEAMAVDLETEGLRFLGKKIVTCALSWKGGTAVSFDWEVLKHRGLKKRFSKALERIECSFHNAMFDLGWFWQEGIYPRLAFDTMLASYVLDERKGIHDLERLSVQRYRAPTYKFSDDQMKDIRKNIPIMNLLAYNATDSDYTRRLTVDLPGDMDEKDRKVMDFLVLPAITHFTKFSQTGMLVDTDQLESNGRRWEEEIEEIEEKLRGFKGASDVNPNSPKQVSAYIFGDLGLRQMGGGVLETIDQATLLDEIMDIDDEEAQEYWRTQSSRAVKDMKPTSTSTYMLFWLAQQHEWPRLMVRHRLLSKKHGTYYKGLKEAMWDDGRIRPGVKLHGTVTGRQSSSEPNTHGTPKDNSIKDIYIADDGFVILYGDYPQAEIRMMAHFAGDPGLAKALSARDVHMAISKVLFRLTDKAYDALPKDKRELMRRAAKTIAFGIIYGRSAKGLAPQMGVTLEEAKEFIDRFFEEMPGVKRWINKQQILVLVRHEVESLYGRKRRFPLIGKKHVREIQRQAVNMPIQSSVSDMTLRAKLQTCDRFDEEGIRYLIWPQIHDSFMTLVEEDARDIAARIMKDTMENCLDFESEVSFGPVDIKCGHSWGSLKTIGG